jgi:hypothetical protein
VCAIGRDGIIGPAVIAVIVAARELGEVVGVKAAQCDPNLAYDCGCICCSYTLCLGLQMAKASGVSLMVTSYFDFAPVCKQNY